jgi:hypothetical protein
MVSPHRDARQPANRPQPRPATSRAVALDMREALNGELLNRRMQRVHEPENSLDFGSRIVGIDVSDAAAYESAASDYTVLPQHRKVFARKAEMFRMLARLGAKQKLFAVPPKERPACNSPDTPHTGGRRMLSKVRHLSAWQQRR